MTTKADFLAEIPLFSFMNEEDLNRIARYTKENLFHKGEVIIREGDHDDRLFMIISGEAEVIKGLGANNERKVRTLGPFSYFGEMAIIDELPRSASVVAKEEISVLTLEKINLIHEIDKYPSFAMELLRMLSLRIRAIDKCVMKTLGSFLPICLHCKRVSEDNITWTPIDKYITAHSDSEVSPRICPECSQKLYPQFYIKR